MLIPKTAQFLKRVLHATRAKLKTKHNPYQHDYMQLNPHASRKLWDILAHITIHHQLGNDEEDLPTQLRREARKHQGQTKKVLNNIAALGHTGAADWIDHFIQWMNAKQNNTPS